MLSKSNWPGNPFIFSWQLVAQFHGSHLQQCWPGCSSNFLWNLMPFLGVSRNSRHAVRNLLESTEKWQVLFWNICASHWNLIFDNPGSIKHIMFGKRPHDFSVEEYGNRKERNCLWIGLIGGVVAFPIWEQEAVDTDQGQQGTWRRRRFHLAPPGQTFLEQLHLGVWMVYLILWRVKHLFFNILT